MGNKKSNPKKRRARTARVKAEPPTFSFCVGRPWPKSADNPNGTSICVYAHGTEVHHGTMADAKIFLGHANGQTGKKNRIYKLVPVSEKL